MARRGDDIYQRGRIGHFRADRLSVGLAALLLGGCATAADIKPGVIRGLNDEGYVKTTEGFGIVTRGCPDPELWAVVLDTAKTFRPTGHVFDYGPLQIVSADESSGVIRAHDPMNFWRKGSYVGIFIHRLTEDTRLVEVSSFWDTRTVVLKNPWERDLLGELVRRLSCVIGSEQAILRMPGGGTAPVRVPQATPTTTRPDEATKLLCRQRANATYSGRERWNEEYRRCLAGY